MAELKAEQLARTCLNFSPGALLTLSTDDVDVDVCSGFTVGAHAQVSVPSTASDHPPISKQTEVKKRSENKNFFCSGGKTFRSNANFSLTFKSSEQTLKQRDGVHRSPSKFDF